MRRLNHGFTIIELLVTVTIIGILSAVGIASYYKVQSNVRDSVREGQITVLSESLEKYYLKFGEYPSCSAITNPVDIKTAAGVLDIVDPNVFTTPTAPKGINSMYCSSDDPISDTFNYSVGSGFVIKYAKNSNNSVITLNSRHGNVVASVPSPSAAVISVSLNGSNVEMALVTPSTCTSGIAEYGFRKRTNDGTWGAYSSWTASLSDSQAANDGVKYGYQAEARCNVDDSSYGSVVESTEVTYTDPIAAPSAPVVTAATVGDTTTWSWPAVTCVAGTAARYQYRYTISPSAFDSGLVSNSANLSVAFTTDTVGQTYTVTVQAQCYNDNATSEWGGDGNASYVRNATENQDVTLIDNGHYHTCAIGSDGDAYCWGYNDYGQLGNGTYGVNVLYPRKIDDGGVLNNLNIKSISAGYHHTCALASDDHVYCWGRNNYGQIGDGTSGVDRISPTAIDMSGVLNGLTIKYITVGDDHSCVIASDNKVYCWGRGSFGQLGNNTTTSIQSSPVSVDMSGVLSGLTVKSISAQSNSNCVIASDDNGYCWGSNAGAELGNGTLGGNITAPTQIYKDGAISGLYVKNIFGSCLIASDNNGYCWGDNEYGDVGINIDESYPNAFHLEPIAIYRNGSISGLSVKAGSHSGLGCMIASDDNAYCWGSNSSGGIGNNTQYVNTLAPAAVYRFGELNGLTIKSISTSLFHACVIASDDKIYCWGDNGYGQLGDGTIGTDRLVPVESGPIPPNPTPLSPSVPVISVNLNGSDVVANINPVTCSTGTAQYGIRSRTNDGVWGSYSAWSTTLTASQVANDGVKYGYQAQARCYVDIFTISNSVESSESVYIDPIPAPSVPQVATSSDAVNTTWSWPTLTCTAGNVGYQYRYTISPSGYDSSWVNNGANLSVVFTTDTVGQTYNVEVQAKCTGTYIASSWSTSGSASFTRIAPTTLPTIVPSSYVTYSGTAPTTTLVGNIDNTVAGYDATYFVAGANSAGTAFYNIADMPSNFSYINSLSYNIRYKITPLGGDTETLSLRIYKSDRTTPLTDTMLVRSTTTAVAEVTKGVTVFAGVSTTATKADWDGAVLAIITNHTKSGGADGSVWSINEVEIGGVYQ